MRFFSHRIGRGAEVPMGRLTSALLRLCSSGATNVQPNWFDNTQEARGIPRMPSNKSQSNVGAV